jgi:ankyrin repeat protein
MVTKWIGIRIALSVASERGHEKIVKLSLENGADVNKKNMNDGLYSINVRK